MIGNLRARIFQSLEPCAGLDRAGNRRHKTAMKTSFAILPLLLLGLTANAASVFTTEQTTNEIRVLADGKLFCAYVFSGAPKPYVYPLTAPDGVTLNREYPMREVAGESHDHPHHRSLWYGHIKTSGSDFWSVSKDAGTTVTEGVPEAKVEDGAVVVKARTKYVAKDGHIVARDEREMKFGALAGGERFIDFSVTIRGEDNGALEFGDDKDGVMGLRLRDEFAFKNADTTARNSEGDDKKTIWGKHARWVDYETKCSGGLHGAAFFDHPQNPKYPTRWHARDYGLLSANPFGEHTFDPKSEKTGGYTIPAGQSATWRYRIVLYAGQKTTDEVEKMSAGFCPAK